MFGNTGSVVRLEATTMAAIPGDVDTDRQPPMTIPLRHFLVAIAFLLAGAGVGIGVVAGLVPGMGSVAHVHLLLAGWVCITIMGAMTQFVPVWSGVELHSQRLASTQLVLVVAGLVGFVAALLAGTSHLLYVFGALLLLGFWVFVYNLGRTLLKIGGLDVTERHFALALGFFLLLTVLGYLLALDFATPVFADLPVARSNVLLAHATLAVFGAVLTTIYGALYQLATMFTQTEIHGVDESLQRVESVGHPVGVVLLASGRLVESQLLAAVGGALVVVAAASVAVVLARKLYEMQVPWTPMHTRYGVAAAALGAWAVVTAPAWLRDATAASARFGTPGSLHLLALGAIGFVVLGTLYHVVPFIVWVHRYSDLLGFEDVPMIDDLYDDRLAAADASLLVAGTALLVAAEFAGHPLAGAGGALVLAGIVVFAANVLLVLRRHSPQPLGRIVLGALWPGGAESVEAEGAPADGRLD